MKYTGLVFLMLGMAACSSQNREVADGQALYAQKCVICHGNDGKLGVSGAKDLSVSRIDQNLSKSVIMNGRGTMPSFKSVLSEEELNRLVQYIEGLRK